MFVRPGAPAPPPRSVPLKAVDMAVDALGVSALAASSRMAIVHEQVGVQLQPNDHHMAHSRSACIVQWNVVVVIKDDLLACLHRVIMPWCSVIT